MADGNSATVPVARLELDGYDWFARHAQILEIQSTVDPEIVLVGDSITHYWGSLPPQPQPTPANGPKAFASVFGARRVLNAGFGWDRTQNVLWRLAHGELDGLSPSLAVVHIGTNNTSGTDNATENSALEIAEGVAAVCSALRAKLGSGCQLVVMKIFPREHHPDDPRRLLINAANALLPDALGRAGVTTNVELLDLRPTMLAADGTLPQALAGDFCHPNEAGYDHWAAALRPFVAALPLRQPTKPPAAAAAGWVIADMDGTLVPKPGRDADGKYSAKGLDDSPVSAPLLRWLECGGNLLCVTSDDGNWPIRKVWSKIPLEYRRHVVLSSPSTEGGGSTAAVAAAAPRVLLSTSDGAALFHGDADGNLIADEEYRRAGSDGGKSATLDPADQPAILSLAREMFLAYLLELATDADKLDQLGRHGRDYVKLFETLAPSSAARASSLDAYDHDWLEEALGEAVTMESLMYPGGKGGSGGLKSAGGTVFWRNQAGPTETWQRSQAIPGTGDSSSSRSRSSSSSSSDTAAAAAAADDFLSLCDPDCLAPYTNLFVLGMPATHSPPFINAFAERFAALGVSASAAPNSVCIKNASVNKATPLRWLMTAPAARRYGFQPQPAAGDSDSDSDGGGVYIAFGDNPGGNDAPLADFDTATLGGDGSMPFVSVAPDMNDVPAALQALHIGEEEVGCAAVIQEMVAVLAAATADGAAGASAVSGGGGAAAGIVQRARERLLREQQGGGGGGGGGGVGGVAAVPAAGGGGGGSSSAAPAPGGGMMSSRM